MMVWPNLVVIGTQKAGTTWLHRAFERHPDVSMSDPKELYYFGHADVGQPDREAWYTSHFAQMTTQWRGEATSNYFWHRDGSKYSPPFDPAADAATGLHRTLGTRAQLFVMLRSPIDRAIAGANHHLTMGRLEPDSDLFNADPAMGIVDLGFYGRHLGHWRSVGCDVQALFFDDLEGDPRAFLDVVYGHLGLSADALSGDDVDEICKPAHTRAQMRAHRGRETLPPFEITSATVERLAEIYGPDIEALEALTERDLAAWRDVDAIAARLVNA